jgi:YbgC/YbaW family acyl-CoA thioester hydrolase
MSTTALQDFRFSHRLRVRWAEVDMQKIVFNAHYLMYFDIAISDYWREMALPYEEAFAMLKGDLYVKKASLEYHASARCDDQLDVALKCARMGTSSITFAGAIRRGDELLVTGELIYVFADPATQKSKPVPDVLRHAFLDYEAGQSLVTLKTGSWEELGADAMKVRVEVFVDEQRIALELEQDAADPLSLHAVAYNRLGQPIATGRLLPSEDGHAKVGRMAVKRFLRGCGRGSEVLQALTEASARRGDSQLLLHAQRTAEPFYARQGFKARGEVFEEAGLAHIEMVRAH